MTFSPQNIKLFNNHHTGKLISNLLLMFNTIGSKSKPEGNNLKICIAH